MDITEHTHFWHHFSGWVTEASLPAMGKVSLGFQKEELPVKCTGNEEEQGAGAPPGHVEAGTPLRNGECSPGPPGDSHGRKASPPFPGLVLHCEDDESILSVARYPERRCY